MRKGTHRTLESRLKHSASISGNKHFQFGIPRSERTKEKIRKANLGKKQSQETINKRVLLLRGKKRTEQSKQKISNAHKGMKKPWAKFNLVRFIGEKHWNWQGGISQFTRSERANFSNTKEYKQWRKSVFERDDYRCLDCGERGGILHADHIYPYSQYPRLRTMLENGRTLCVSCHRKTDTYGGYSKVKFLGLK